MGPETQTSLSFRANPEVTQKRAHQLFFQRAIVLGPESFVQRRIYGPVYRVLTQIKILRPIGVGLDDQAAKGVTQWHFEPARREGKPVPVLIDIEVNFRLR